LVGRRAIGIVAFLGLLLGVLPRFSQQPWTIIGSPRWL
jgi:hypothetical protein